MNDRNNENDIIDAGTGFGNEAAEHLDRRAEAYSDYERQRIELTNQPRVNALHVEGQYLVQRECQLEERLMRAAPAADLRRRRQRARYYWTSGIILTLAAFFFSLIGFAPFRLGWMGILYCIGIALATPFAVEEFLEAWKSEKLFKIIATGVFCAALMGGTFLAAIRGDLLAEQVKQSSQANASVVVDGQTPAPQQEKGAFYESTRGLLRLLMLFLALAIDLGAGVAIHRARLLGDVSGEDPDLLLRELHEVQQRKAEVIYEITALTNAPTAFVAQFWRDFYRAMLTQTARKAVSKLSAFSLLLLLFTGCASRPPEKVRVVAAVDLSTSEAATGRDLKSAFSKNIEGVGRLLGSLPPGSDITVIGITDNSFAQPYVLLSAKISDDQGYFGERIAAARRELLRTWHDRAAKLTPEARGTDIMGALLFADQLFRRAPADTKKYLFLFSDMRHVTRGLNLEVRRTVPTDTLLTTVARHRLLANLPGVTVYVLGADAEGMPVTAWDDLRQFWTAYFTKAGASLAAYSSLSDPPILPQPASAR